MKKSPLVLLDADMTLYRYAAACEREVQWEEDIWMLWSDLSEVRELFWADIDHLLDLVNSPRKSLCLCFTDRSLFRRRLDPEYKGKRKTRKPLGYKAMRDELAAEPMAYIQADLEADDVISILAWRARAHGQPYVVVSGDKDLLQIPGTHVHVEATGEWVPTHILEADAARSQWLQALTGDQTDNVPGCPGLGPKRAERVLEGILDWSDEEVWPVVLKAYEKAGKDAAYATLQINLTRLLRPEQINPDGTITPWTPPSSPIPSRPAASSSDGSPRRSSLLSIASSRSKALR